MDIRTNISQEVAKKILGNTGKAIAFLSELQKVKEFDLPTKIIKSGINKGEKVLSFNRADEIWSKITEQWDFEIGRQIIRELFKATDKYKVGKDSYAIMNTLIQEWNEINLGDISWSFSQGKFDGFVQTINAQNISRFDKDEQVTLAAVKYRRIKEINTVRNDFIETLIFEKNENVVPTLGHRRLVDFFINGVSFDQKVSKSPTGEFQRDFGADWKNYAIEHSEVVAEYLYTYQDEGRFGADNRLLVVYLDENVPFERIEEIIHETNLEHPLEITFAYRNNQNNKHTVNCFVILLYNKSD